MLQNFKNFCNNLILKITYFYNKNKFFVISFYILFALLCANLNFYRPALFGLFLLLYNLLEQVPFLKRIRSTLEKDQKTILYHWENDKDLIILNKISRFLLIIFLLLFSYYAVEFYSAFYSKNCGKSFDNIIDQRLIILMVFSITISRLIVFFAEIHIIFFRNFPVDYKLLNLCGTCVKILAFPLSGLGALDMASSSINLSPTPLGNWYQINSPNGRGYGFTNHRQHMQIFSAQLLENFSAKDLVDPKTNMIDQAKLNHFIKQNEVLIKTKLPLADCQNLGVTKNRFI